MRLNQGGAFLLPPGEGQGEGIEMAESLCLLLHHPTLSRGKGL